MLSEVRAVPQWGSLEDGGKWPTCLPKRVSSQMLCAHGCHLCGEPSVGSSQADSCVGAQNRGLGTHWSPDPWLGTNWSVSLK